SFEELERVFGQNCWITDLVASSRRQVLCQHRSRLCVRLRAYIEEWRRLRIAVEILVDGSFVTNKPDPNDIDLIVVLPEDYDFTSDPPLQVESLLTKNGLKYKQYPFDVKAVPSASTPYAC